MAVPSSTEVETLNHYPKFKGSNPTINYWSEKIVKKLYCNVQ
jgi:hypothetical protein